MAYDCQNINMSNLSFRWRKFVLIVSLSLMNVTNMRWMVMIPLWTMTNPGKHSQGRILHFQLWVWNLILSMRLMTFTMFMLRMWALASESVIHGFVLRKKNDIELNLAAAVQDSRKRVKLTIQGQKLGLVVLQ
uniref:Transmembrane protein n=1 Tax=Cucumis sativus TaxID=3659 RepID=A0A0A0LDN7_CUCSA